MYGVSGVCLLLEMKDDAVGWVGEIEMLPCSQVSGGLLLLFSQPPFPLRLPLTYACVCAWGMPRKHGRVAFRLLCLFWSSQATVPLGSSSPAFPPSPHTKCTGRPTVHSHMPRQARQRPATNQRTTCRRASPSCPRPWRLCFASLYVPSTNLRRDSVCQTCRG